jgi:hypothetical protein
MEVSDVHKTRKIPTSWAAAHGAALAWRYAFQ